MTPNVRRNATGINSIATISTTFVNGVGFSNGCALLTLKAPPPSPDISLMDSHVATGPPRIVCLPPAKRRNLLCTMQIVDHAEARAVSA